MDVNPMFKKNFKPHLSWIFFLAFPLIIGGGAYFSFKNQFIWDLTLNHTNTLTPQSLMILDTIKEPLNIELFTKDDILENRSSLLINAFSQINPLVKLSINPPVLKNFSNQDLPLNSLRISFKNEQKIIDLDEVNLNEEIFANYVYQLINHQEQWIVFFGGHNEPDPFGKGKLDLNSFTQQLSLLNMHMSEVNFQSSNLDLIPDNTTLLVINAPKTAPLAFELDLINQYLQKGENLLFLIDDKMATEWRALTDSLGIAFKASIILDKQGEKLGTPHPGITLISGFEPHPIFNNLNQFILFPFAIPLEKLPLAQNPDFGNFKINTLLSTHQKTQLEDYDLSMNKQNTQQGPFTIGYTLTRELDDLKKEQRIVILGNTQFLSNRTFDNYGNKSFALNLFQWLSVDLPLSKLTRNVAIDIEFIPNPYSRFFHNYFFPYLNPLIFLGFGWFINKARTRKIL
ncbi:MAG: transporter [Francisellaceae bacterium]|nr:transporter [Francisellaceae bacterium]